MIRHIAVLTSMLTLALAGVDANVAAAPTPRKPYIVVLHSNVADPAGVASTHGQRHGFRPEFVYHHALKGYSASLPDSAVAALSRDHRVLFLSPDRELAKPPSPPGGNQGKSGSMDVCPLDTRSGFPTQCVPPGVARIGGHTSSVRSGDGRGAVAINVAVLDDGIDSTHKDLNVVGGTNCSGDRLGSTDIAGTHGTFVAGSIAAKDNSFGVTGLVPGARLWSVRVFRKNGPATDARLICGIDFVTASRTDADTTNDIAVANMSLGGQVKNADDGNCGRSNRDATHLAICNSLAAGALYAVAAGNESVDIKDVYPAAYDEVLTSAAMADYDGVPGGLDPTLCHGEAELTDDKAAFFSNFASTPSDQEHTVAAPGVCVVSTVRVGFFGTDETIYGIGSGTSFASPHVAGLAALCIASGDCAGLAPQEIVQKIVADTAAYNQTHPEYGYEGDPLHEGDPGKYYGFLIRADLY